MEIYILSKEDLKILDIQKVSDYEINIDEETNAKTTFKLIKNDGIKDGNYILVNGLFRQFIFVIPEGGVVTEKSSNMVMVSALDISNIFDRKIIEKDTETMTTTSIESYIADMISENFVNSDDPYINIPYIDIYWSTNTQGIVATNSENGLYNFHTFLINCRQYKNIYTEFKVENGRLRIDISYKSDAAKLIDTTLPEITDYNKVYETDITAKVEVLVREDNSVYNLYLKNDRTTTTDKDDPDRATGKVEVISVETSDKAYEEALNVIKGNSYKHLVEFKIPKSSQLMDVTALYVGRKIIIKTDEDVYTSYISAMTLKDENYIYFKSGSLRIDFLDKVKKNDSNSVGNKLDLSGGVIRGNVNVNGDLKVNGESINKSIATVGLSSQEQYGYSDYNIIEFDTVHSQKSNKFTLNANGQIVIGAGISYIKINANIGMANSVAGQTPFIRIYKNGTANSTLQLGQVINTAWSNAWLCITPFLLSVEEGDVIDLRINGGTADVYVRTTSYLTIEEI